MKNNKDIIFNVLPPAQINMPSAAFSVLKSFMEKNNYSVEVVYWNITLSYIMIEYIQQTSKDEYDLLYLLPFLIYLSKTEDDDETYQKVCLLLKSKFPRKSAVVFDYTDKFSQKIIQEIDLMFNQTYKAEDIANCKVIGFSAKFDQWIPAMVFAKKLKQLGTKAKLVMGGFPDKTAAIEFLKISKDFDYAIWGEGEVPLLKLCETIDNENILSLENVPQLIWRNTENEISFTVHMKKEAVVFNTFPDFSDYFNYSKIKYFKNSASNILRIPIETSRGCNWNRCMFCYLNSGYVYKEKSYDEIISEIEYLVATYKIYDLCFVTNDLIGKDRIKFEKLLDYFIYSNTNSDREFSLSGEIIHKNFSALLVKKMAIAGFNEVQIGFEALNNQTLTKFNKKSSFADNLFFIKFASKFGIKVIGANILTGYPDETLEEIITSESNLHLLRFFLSKKDLELSVTDLLIAHNSKFYKKIPKSELDQWNGNNFIRLIPKNLTSKIDRFTLFSFSKVSDFKHEWRNLHNLISYYYNNDFHYKVSSTKNKCYYSELINTILIKQIELTDLDQRIFSLINDTIFKLENLIQELSLDDPDTGCEVIVQRINYLKNEGLLYFDNKSETIFSIIDFKLPELT